MSVAKGVWTVIAVWVVATGSGWQATRASVQQPAAQGSTGSGDAADLSMTGVAPDIECPVTIPPQPGFTPPAPYPETAPFEGHEWYGSDELWTALAVDGELALTKMPLWWSVNFPGAREEPHPDVRISWTRLMSDDETSLIDRAGMTTNGYTSETGWLMMAGAYPRRGTGEASGLDVGCWRVEAVYKGATLSYVLELSEPTEDS